MEIEHTWRATQQLDEWLRFADAKATACLVANGAIGALLTYVSSVEPTAPVPRATAMVLALCGVLISIAFCLRVLIPRVKATTPAGELFFGHIVRRYGHDRLGFAAEFLAVAGDPERLRGQLVDQLWAKSDIASRKFGAASWAVRALVVAVASLAVGGILGRLGW